MLQIESFVEIRQLVFAFTPLVPQANKALTLAMAAENF